MLRVEKGGVLPLLAGVDNGRKVVGDRAVQRLAEGLDPAYVPFQLLCKGGLEAVGVRLLVDNK